MYTYDWYIILVVVESADYIHFLTEYDFLQRHSHIVLTICPPRPIDHLLLPPPPPSLGPPRPPPLRRLPLPGLPSPRILGPAQRLPDRRRPGLAPGPARGSAGRPEDDRERRCPGAGHGEFGLGFDSTFRALNLYDESVCKSGHGTTQNFDGELSLNVRILVFIGEFIFVAGLTSWHRSANSASASALSICIRTVYYSQIVSYAYSFET